MNRLFPLKPLLIGLYLLIFPCLFAHALSLEMKQLGGAYVSFSCNSALAIPVVAGDSYMLHFRGDSLLALKTNVEGKEKDFSMNGKNDFYKIISISAFAQRGTRFYMNVSDKQHKLVILHLEVVSRGKVEAIRYNDLVAKRVDEIDVVKSNTSYSLVFQGKEMQHATLCLNRLPHLINGTFITIVGQQNDEKNTALNLNIRIGKAEKELTTSLLYFIAQIGIRDKNADIDVPWARYTIGSGKVFDSDLPLDGERGNTNLNVMKVE